MKHWMLSLGISTLLLLHGCDESTGRFDPNGPFGRHLPTSESAFDALGLAALELDRDQTPLRKLDVLEGDWTLTGDYQDGQVVPRQPSARSANLDGDCSSGVSN